MFKRYRDNRGATAIEYGIIAAGIAVAIMAGLTVTGTNTKQTFCTIASAIGTGSGNCSGSSSGNSSGSSSSSGSSYSDLVGITTKAQFDALNASFGGKLDMTYVSNTFGGDDSAATEGLWTNQPVGERMENKLKVINATDPITNVFGLYNASGEPVTSYQDAIKDFDIMGTEDVLRSNRYADGNMMVTTQSGKSYEIQN